MCANFFIETTCSISYKILGCLQGLFRVFRRGFSRVNIRYTGGIMYRVLVLYKANYKVFRMVFYKASAGLRGKPKYSMSIL